MATLRVRAYNVRFGDAVLVTVPDRTDGAVVERRILIDVGNVLGGAGGIDAVFEPVVDDVLAQLDGRSLDLYVMTHEHLDHVQGLPHAAAKLGKTIPVEYAWLTASAQPGYYRRFPDARRKRLEAREAYRAIARFFTDAMPAIPDIVRAFLANNNPASTDECVKYLRRLAKRTTYVYRGRDLRGAHPFHEASFEVWAPERDTADYYGRFRPMALTARSGVTAGGRPARSPVPPPGVDAGSFYNLVELRRRGLWDNLLAIDQAANNTSVVFCLEWRGWRLLFPGDAEVRSWKTMRREQVLKPVHVLKVSHHGSHNGTPDGEVFDTVLPEAPPDGRARFAVVSTHRGTYEGVPHEPTERRIQTRCTLVSTASEPEKPYVDVELEA